jgi:hypothetical protein
MNAKYAEKPIPNPNEPIKPFVGNFRVAHLPRKRQGAARRCGFVAGSFNRKSSIDNRQWPERTQFFHDQIGIINIKNAEMKVQNRLKKTKRTQS